MGEDGDAGGAVLRGRVRARVVADALVLAPDEDHRRRGDRRQLLGVVTCTGHQADGVIAQICGGCGDRVLDAFVEGHLARDRKSTRLNSSHVSISYAVFCLKKKKTMMVRTL